MNITLSKVHYMSNAGYNKLSSDAAAYKTGVKHQSKQTKSDNPSLTKLT